MEIQIVAEDKQREIGNSQNSAFIRDKGNPWCQTSTGDVFSVDEEVSHRVVNNQWVSI